MYFKHEQICTDTEYFCLTYEIDKFLNYNGTWLRCVSSDRSKVEYYIAYGLFCYKGSTIVLK